jgi:photosystem I P700 chlorophyll a apoprotein A2
VAALVHAGIFLGRDYTFVCMADSCRILKMKDQLISHLSWVCLYLGFHTLGVYIHNDTVVAFGEPEKQILIEPVFAQIIQESSSLIMPIGPGDLLAHHAIALGLHVTVLIALKGCLDSRGSKLMPDKINFGYGFACDGPTRGGTCDISAWDSFYLAMFWMLNTDAWLMFYFHWKHLTLWQNTVFQFDESSTYLNGWFRDYLWFNSAPLINGYNAFGANDLSVLSWIFLGAHLCWATGFMFLISWRGYWQELIDIIVYMHLKTPILYDLWKGGVYTPVALSIVQARFIGLVHFSAGFILTYAAFISGATS